MDAAEGVHKLKVDAEVRNQILEDLYKWEEEMRERDANYKNTKQDQLNSMGDLPPVRGSPTLQLNGHLPDHKTVKNEAAEKEPVLSPVARKQKSEEEKEKGNDLFKKGKLEEALSAYARALEADKMNIACYSNRALVLNKLRRYKEAEDECTLALQLDPNYVKALHRRGVARVNLKQYENAKEDFQKANALEPGNQTVISELKAVEKELSKIEDKKKNEKIESAPEKPSDNRIVDATKREEVFLVEELRDVNETQKEVKTPVEWKEEGNRLYEKGDVATAIECYTNAINMDPSEAIYTSNRGMAYLSLGRNEEAENDCTKAINLNPRHTKSYQRRGVARLNLGKLEEALSDFQEVRRLDPKNKLVASQIEEVEKLLQERKSKEKTETKIKEGLVPVLVQPVSSTRDEKKLIGEFHSRFKVSGEISSKTAPDSVPVTSSSPSIVVRNVTSPTGAVVTPSTGEKVPSGPLYSIVMPVPPVPKYYAQFWLDWKKMKNSEDAKYRYLKQLRSSDVAAIFREALEPEDLSEILSVLASSFVPKKDPVLPFLTTLQTVKRFKSAAMFLNDQDHSRLNLLFNAAKENDEDSSSTIDAVRSAWVPIC